MLTMEQPSVFRPYPGKTAECPQQSLYSFIHSRFALKSLGRIRISEPQRGLFSERNLTVK